MLKDGSVLLVDYENVGLTPFEYDLVNLSLFLRFYHSDGVLADRFVSRFSGEVDNDLLNGFMFMRMLSGYSFVLLDSDSEDNLNLFVRRLNSLEEFFLQEKNF